MLKMENNNLTFKDIISKNNNLNSEKNSSEKLKGWVYFNKNELNKKYKKENSNVSIKSRKINETTKDIYNFYEKLSIRWNKYRDEKNDLWGDTSPYINYKYDIEKMVYEENMILEEIYNTSVNYSSSSDDDFN